MKEKTLKNKYNKIILIVLAVILVLLATLGVSVAIFRYIKESNTQNKITVGDLTFHYTEVNGVGHGINIVDAFPISDSEGKALNGEGKYFEFSIEANLLNRDLDYEIVVEPTENSNINLDAIKFYLTEINDNDSETEVGLTVKDNGKVKTLADYENTDITGQTGKVVYIEKIPAKTKNYNRRFKARMWINEDIDYASDGYIGRTGSYRINVYTNGNLLLDALHLTYTSKINPETDEPYTACTNVQCAIDELFNLTSED